MIKSISHLAAVILLFAAIHATVYAADYFPLHTGDAWYLYAIP